MYFTLLLQNPKIWVQWNLAYPALAYPAAWIIRPQYFGSHVVKNGYEKHDCISLEAKLDITIRLKKGESQSSLTSEYIIGKLRVGDFKKSEKKIRQFATMMKFWI